MRVKTLGIANLQHIAHAGAPSKRIETGGVRATRTGQRRTNVNKKDGYICASYVHVAPQRATKAGGFSKNTSATLPQYAPSECPRHVDAHIRSRRGWRKGPGVRVPEPTLFRIRDTRCRGSCQPHSASYRFPRCLGNEEAVRNVPKTACSLVGQETEGALGPAEQVT